MAAPAGGGSWRAGADAAVAFLVREGLCLTALELYQELLERGRELPALRLYVDAQVAAAPAIPSPCAAPSVPGGRAAPAAAEAPCGGTETAAARPHAAAGGSDAVSCGSGRTTGSGSSTRAHKGPQQQQAPPAVVVPASAALLTGASPVQQPRRRPSPPEEGAASETARLQSEVRRLTSENERLRRQLSEDGLRNTSPSDVSPVGSSAGGGSAAGRRLRQLEHEIRTLSQRLRRFESAERGVVQVVADRLPTVITSVGSSRKECLTHILLTVIEHHTEAQVRSSLLYYYAHLFKRPGAEERRTVADGLRSLAERVDGGGHVRAEELVAAVRSLSDHRYPEGRVLAAEAAAGVIPLLPAPAQAELLCGFLRCLRSDAQSIVREAAVVAMAQSLPASAGRAVAEFVCSSSVAAVQDTSQRVQCAALSTALPALAAAGAKAGWLTELLADPVLDAVQSAEPASVPPLCAALGIVIAALREHLLATVPAEVGAAPEGLGALLGRAVARSIKGRWHAAEWLLERCIPCLLRAIAAPAAVTTPQQSPPPSGLTATPQDQAKLALVALLCSAERKLGSDIRDTTVRPGFEELVLTGGDGGRPQWDLLRWYLCWALRLTGDGPPGESAAPSGGRAGATAPLGECDPGSREQSPGPAREGLQQPRHSAALPARGGPEQREEVSKQFRLSAGRLSGFSAALAEEDGASSADGDEPQPATGRHSDFAVLEGLRDAASAFVCRCVAAAAAESERSEVARCLKALSAALAPGAVTRPGREGGEVDCVAAVAVDGLWKCVVERDPGTRRAAGRGFGELLRDGRVPTRLLARRVLPALQTLSEDPVQEVREAALRPLAVLSTLADPATQSDVLANIGAALAKGSREAGGSIRGKLLLARAWSGLMPRVPPRLAQDVALPHLVQGLHAAAAAEAQASPGSADSLSTVLAGLLVEQAKGVAPLMARLKDPQTATAVLCAALRELAAASHDTVQRTQALSAVRDIEHALRHADDREPSGSHLDGGISRPSRFLHQVQQGLQRLAHSGAAKEDAAAAAAAAAATPPLRTAEAVLAEQQGGRARRAGGASPTAGTPATAKPQPVAIGSAANAPLGDPGRSRSATPLPTDTEDSAGDSHPAARGAADDTPTGETRPRGFSAARLKQSGLLQGVKRMFTGGGGSDGD
eukprot:TRINITY_DN5645_c0_g1_i3.p1 TRINITY_DN5645_c0_g1~~TRINITY_DN5645_c0_g1_i3.p1  ORF type:complete len:1186 (+),score=307.61 TRINITY_DN5645_c0_g1_i3:66-3560(+)